MEQTEVNRTACVDRIEECVYILRQETSLLERFAAAQEVVRHAVFAREWVDLEALLNRLDGYAQDFQALETERARIFEEVLRTEGRNGDSVGFYTIISRLPEGKRRELTDLYRRLKLDTLKVRLANEALTRYLSEAKTTVSNFLEAAFPDRKGRLYTRRGTQMPSEMRSIVLDRSF